MFLSWFSTVLIGLQFSVRFTEGRLQDDWKDYIDPEILQRDLGKDHSERFSPIAFEGDIDGLLEDRDISQLKSLSKNVLHDKETRWTNGIVPYRFRPNLFSAPQEALVKRSMNEISLLTRNCIRFVERKDEKDYVLFSMSFGCSSNIGKQGTGAQIVRLNAGCMAHMGDIQHELMHVLGFYHEMSRTDRDQYVTINWENIETENRDQFKMYTDGDTFGLPYDYESVMQYPFNAFARNSATPTIVPKQKHARIGQSKNLSPLDVLKIQKAYLCDSIPDPTSVDSDEDQEKPSCPVASCPSTSCPVLSCPSTSRPSRTANTQERRSGCSCSNTPDSADLFPAFLFKPTTKQECQSLNTGTCSNVAETSWNCVGDSVFKINCEATVDELVTVSSKIKNLDKSRPVYFVNYDRQTVAEVFAPIRKVVLRLDILQCLNSMTTSKLPLLKIPNLLDFGLYGCNGVVIHKEDFANNRRLRNISFQRVTIENMETGTFTNLLDLQRLSFESFWTKADLTVEYIAHLLRLHCDCEYSWFRRWLKQNPILISPKKEREIYNFGGFYNVNANRTVTFIPVDCSNKDLNEAVFDDSQLSYSVNDFC